MFHDNFEIDGDDDEVAAYGELPEYASCLRSRAAFLAREFPSPHQLLAGRAGNILEAGCAYLDVAHIMPRTGPDLGHLYNAPVASIFSPLADPPTNQGPGECKQQ